MENSSQVGVLAQLRSSPRNSYGGQNGHGQQVHRMAKEMADRFFNIPPVRLFLSEERQAFQRGLEQFRQQQLGQHYGGGGADSGSDSGDGKCRGELATIYSSSDEQCRVGSIAFANERDVANAITRSREAFERSGGWAELPLAQRASYLLALGQELLLNRVALAHLISFEAGKAPLEALGDVDEAVDFLHFYARTPASAPPMPRPWPSGGDQSLEFSPGHSLWHGGRRPGGGQYGVA